MKKVILNTFVLSVIFTGLFFTGCSKEENEDELRYQAITGDYITIKIIDNQGNNLLNSDHSGKYSIDDIEYIYYFNGKKKTFNDPTLSNPKNMQIIDAGENGSELKVFPLSPIVGSTTETFYLEFEGNDPDEIKAQYTILKGNDPSLGYGPTSGCKLEKIWLNGNLVSVDDPIILKKQSKKK